MKKKQRKVRLIRAAIQLIFFIAAPSLFFYGICRNQNYLSCDRRTAERNLELFSGYYGITVDHYYFVRTSFLRLCLCVWLVGRCSV